MIELQEAHQAYVSQFERRERELAGAAWFKPTRKAAIARFAEVGFPSTSEEDWLYTNVERVGRVAFEPPPAVARQLAASKFADYMVEGSHCLIFVDGRHVPELSTRPALPAGVIVESLATALETRSAELEPHLARHARYQDNAFAALNTAFIEDGAFIRLPKGAVVPAPIHLLFVSTAPGRIVTHPRVLLVAETSSQATIIESHAGLAPQGGLTNAVTEMVIGENAVIEYLKVIRHGPADYHLATVQSRQFRSSRVNSHILTFGGDLVRNDIKADLAGEGGSFNLHGLIMIGGTQHVDHHVRVEHAQPHCDSRQVFKGVYDGRSRGVFSGRIYVHPAAQKTDAKQTNMNLLLSEEALADSKPQLEIFADDVKCTHGATVGQIDEEAIFYLRSRGIGFEAARSLLVYAFANEILDGIAVAPLRARLNGLLLERLPQGELIRGAL